VWNYLTNIQGESTHFISWHRKILVIHRHYFYWLETLISFLVSGPSGTFFSEKI
jgi:hypothetical protein